LVTTTKYLKQFCRKKNKKEGWDMKPVTELLSLVGKAAIVTGGANGIGLGIARRLAEAGAKVLIVDLDKDNADQAVLDITSNGWSALTYEADVSNEEDIKSMIATCKKYFGSVDILVNNAGIYPNKPLSQMSQEDFEKVIHTNLRSVFLATKYAAKTMKEQGKGGRIINITSIDAIRPSMTGLAHYDASKHGVWGFTKNVALELASDKIWVNSIAPGGIVTPGTGGNLSSQGQTEPETQMANFLSKIPMHRMGEPDEIGKVALFLASDISSYMTGSQIVVDGGALLV
jgi:2-deoxy-D-gluconate 3-dehydrogenase